jgi:hypothetical protein
MRAIAHIVFVGASIGSCLSVAEELISNIRIEKKTQEQKSNKRYKAYD